MEGLGLGIGAFQLAGFQLAGLQLAGFQLLGAGRTSQHRPQDCGKRADLFPLRGATERAPLDAQHLGACALRYEERKLRQSISDLFRGWDATRAPVGGRSVGTPAMGRF